MSRKQLSFVIAASAAPQAETLLELAGAETIALSDAADEPVLEPEPNTAPLWPQVVVRAQFPADAELARLGDLLHDSCGASKVAIETLRATDWEAGMRQMFEARPFGRRLWLAPADDTSPAPAGRTTVRLHMGFAFGTGHHPTTSLCLDWIDEHVAEGSTFLDYGCGSGVLALAALALGAVRAWAVDNDEQALAATRANAALNSVTDRLFLGSPDALPTVAVDVLVANILAAPLIERATVFAEQVRRGGKLVLSGILERQAASVMTAYAAGFSDFECAVREGWVRIACTRKG